MTSFSMEPLLEGLLRSLGGSEANFLEVCFGTIPCGNFHTKATSKSRPPSGNFRPNPPELPRSPSRSFSSREAGRKIVLFKVILAAIWRRVSGFALQTPRFIGVIAGRNERVACKRVVLDKRTRA